ncbi:MAG: aminotransferase class V-fold PLP-dependent enzyme, partial [Phycisphaeraceae bacterium]
MQWVYLDNNATTQPAAEVLTAMAEVHEQLWANPSSVHRFGQAVRQRLELARSSVAKLLAAKPREIVFTSGG